MKEQVKKLPDEALLKGAATLADGLEQELPDLKMGVATLRELVRRYEDLRWRMDQLEK